MRHNKLSIGEIKLRCAAIGKIWQYTFSDPYSILGHIHDNAIRRAKVVWPFIMMPNFCHGFFRNIRVVRHMRSHEHARLDLICQVTRSISRGMVRIDCITT